MNTAKHGRKISKVSKDDKSKYRNPEDIPMDYVPEGGRKCKIRLRGQRWQADFGEVNGKRLRRSFPIEPRFPFGRGQAEDWLREQATLLSNEGIQGFNLTERQRLDAAQALEVLGGIPGTTLLQAAEYFAQYCSPSAESQHVTIAQLAHEYYADAERHGLRPASLRDIQNVSKRLVAFCGDEMVESFSRKQAHDFINALELSATSKRHYQTVAGGMFNFAIDNEYAEMNPFQRRGKRTHKSDETMPECFTAAEAKALLEAAVAHDQSLVASLAVGLFTGLRTSELRKLVWSNIDLDEKRLQVTPQMAKSRSVRYVSLSDNLVKWLEPYKQESGFVAPEGEAWRSRLDRVRTLGGISNWPHNAMRHSFASFHLAQHGDDKLTASEMGHHGDTTMLYKHYRAIVTKEDAQAYWTIVPEEAAGVVASKAG